MKKVLVLSGEGINCEVETAAAFKRAEIAPTIMSVRSFLARPECLLNYQVLALPGGFSFGDEITSGQVLGLALKDALQIVWPEFIARQGLAIGICNGFQILMKMGVFGPFTLAANAPHGFQDRWIGLQVESSNCVWTKGMAGEELFLPMRHGEGRIWTASEKRQENLKTLSDQGQIVLRYQGDPNGSLEQIAGLCDPTGQVFGLMPHPEAALDAALFPVKALSAKTALHQKLFHNAALHLQETHA